MKISFCKLANFPLPGFISPHLLPLSINGEGRKGKMIMNIMRTRFSGTAIAGILLCFYTVNYAQIEISPGLVTGISSYKQKTRFLGVDQYTESKKGIIAGAVCEFSGLKVLSAEIGTFYSMRGGEKETAVVYDNLLFVNENTTYLSLPLHIKIKYPSQCINPYVFAGINIAILLTARDEVVEYKLTQMNLQPGPPELDSLAGGHDNSDAFNKIDFGMDFGFGIQLNLLRFTPFVEFVYCPGLSDLMKQGLPTKSIGWELKTGVKLKIK
jgi:hypothetical protein